jgi:hypothetical protein
VEKRVVMIGAARQIEPAAVAGEEKTPVLPKTRWRFAKLFGPTDHIKFRDGSSFQFRLIKRSDGNGYLPGSRLDTDNTDLAGKLRAAAKNPALGIVEVKMI